MKTRGLYKNDQKISEQKGDVLTHYFDNGVVRAKGRFVGGKMQGRWKFNRKTGQLWVVGNFKDNRKHGLWLRYDRKDEEEYREKFADGKPVKAKSAKVKSAKAAPKRSR